MSISPNIINNISFFKNFPRNLSGVYIYWKSHDLYYNDEFVSLLQNEIEKLKHLEYNWDSFNAEQISTESINITIDLLKVFALNNILINSFAPLRDGGIQLDISLNKNDLEIEIHPDSNITVLIFDKEANFCKEFNYNISEIEKLFKIIKSLN